MRWQRVHMRTRPRIAMQDMQERHCTYSQLGQGPVERWGPWRLSNKWDMVGGEDCLHYQRVTNPAGIPEDSIPILFYLKVEEEVKKRCFSITRYNVCLAFWPFLRIVILFFFPLSYLGIRIFILSLLYILEIHNLVVFFCPIKSL